MIKKCHGEREQWDWELIFKACDYVRSKLFPVCVCVRQRCARTHTHTLIAPFPEMYFPLLSWTDLTNAESPSEFFQSVTNTTLFNLFRPSFVLLSCLRRLTLTFKHTVSTIFRQSSMQPVSIILKQTHSAVIWVRRPHVFHFQTGLTIAFVLSSFL